MTLSKAILDDLLKGVERPEDLLGDAGLMKELKIKLMERMLGAELTAHLGCEEGKDAPPGQTNRRNGSSSKVLGRARTANCRWRCLATATAASSPSWCRRVRPGSTGWMTRSSGFMRPG